MVEMSWPAGRLPRPARPVRRRGLETPAMRRQIPERFRTATRIAVVIGAGLLVVLATGRRAGAGGEPTGAATGGESLFKERIAPILESKCVRCHGAGIRKGGLSLATASALRAGGESGPVVEPGR